jgi:hypothetical protein
LAIEKLEDRLVPDATSFVTSLYHNVLNRAPETAGLNFWVGKIQNGMSNVQVATGFWQSIEHRNLEVNIYYQTFLGRTPSAGELSFWVTQMTSGKMGELAVQAQFALSDEFLADNNSPAAFVGALYEDFLGRAPTLSEQASWQNVLATDGPATVTVGIEKSAESYTRIIDNCYITYLNRSADSAGLAFWLNQIQTGRASVGLVAELILGSAEYAAIH